jgi:hypothetical protein
MKTLIFAITKILAVALPILLFVGGTAWFCNLQVRGSDGLAVC